MKIPSMSCWTWTQILSPLPSEQAVSTQEGSHQLIKKLKKGKGQEVIAYFAGYGLGPDDITAVLDSCQTLGIENILVVRGDQPQEEDFQPHPQSLPHASDLLKFIRPKYDFCIGVAGYPEGHVEAESKAKDLEYLKLKVEQWCGVHH